MKRLIKSGILLCISLLGIIINSCQDNSDTPSGEFTTYIKAYTGGMIQKDGCIRIEFASGNTVSPSATKGELPTNGLFSFSPALKGKTVWVSDDCVEFIPENLESGIKYKAVFALDKVADVDNPSLRKFKFSFMTRPSEADLLTDTPTIPATDKDCAVLSGKVICSEPSTCAEIKEMLQCSEKTEITVSEGRDAMEFFFKTGKIAKREEEFSVNFRLEGSRERLVSDGEKTVTIPAKDDFSVIGHSIIEDKDPYVLVTLSEPLAQGTDPEGLVRLENVKRFLPKIEDNKIRIYFERRRNSYNYNNAENEEITVLVSGFVKNVQGKTLGQDFTGKLKETRIKPAVKFLNDGNILPDSEKLILPFRAVNLSAVDISVIQIYENNVLMFLQNNGLDEDNEIRRAGRMVYKKTLWLDSEGGKDLGQWQDFAIDLSGLFKKEPGAIYRICLSFKQEYSLYGKASNTVRTDGGLVSTTSGEMTDDEEREWDIASPYYSFDNIDWMLYDWKDRNNPMTPSYYMKSDRMPKKNLLASNLGIIAKRAGSNKIWLNVNDIITTEPVPDAEVTAYNYQLQKIGTCKTGKDGEAEMETEGKVFIITARHGNSISYLKTVDGEEKSTSRFDTSGEQAETGLKGYAYGERGVWRPGDTLHVTFVLGDRKNLIPDSHPVTMEVYTPQGQFFEKQINTSGTDGFYRFDIATSDDCPTGIWNAYFKVGGSTFHKSLRIETIKPNRIKIKMPESEGKILEPGEIPVNISANWLTGPPAAGLKTTVEVTAKKTAGNFAAYPGYCFTNPAVEFHETTEKILDTRTDERGRIAAKARLSKSTDMPGPMKLTFVAKVHENGGDVSIVAENYDFSPFKAYVGVRMPESSSRYLETDKDNFIDVAVVDKNGNALKGRKLEYRIYRLDWSWWWESRSQPLDSYVNNSSIKPCSSGTFTSSGKGEKIKFRIDYPDWGRFLICVKDLEGGHMSGGIVMVDWPSWRGRSDKKDPEALTMLAFNLDKKEYNVGEEATVYIPASKGGRALVSLENSFGIISREWVRTDAENETKHKILITKEMCPNFYVHITLLQPYGNAGNDLPVRMYGVQPVFVSDKDSRLIPVITAPEVIRPQEKFTIKVGEKNGREMTYTLAIVDEGLLDITSFKTPDPWNRMYAREALAVRTWDLYDNIVGSYGGRFSSMFAIGGDESITKPGQRDNRFNPVVRFMGPFKAGKKGNSHEITLPMYVGSVRIMVVAGKDGAYGNGEKTAVVRSPLMVLPTLPRVLSTGETAVLPVNVFALEDNIRDVRVSVSCEGAASISSSTSESLTFDKAGDKIQKFEIRTGKTAGKAKITVTATGGGYSAKEEINMEVRNPQPFTTHSEGKVLKNGEKAEFSYPGFKPKTGEWVRMEMTGFPAMDFDGCMDMAVGYKYDCSEQLASKGLTILALKDLAEEGKAEIASEIIPSLLQKLYGRQASDGGFAYWPSQGRSNEWVTSMVGEFMLRAAQEGYEIDSGVLLKWKKHQQNAARNFRLTDKANCEDLSQAYRLYTLALGTDPENGAMNRLKEYPSLSSRAAWKLASTYALCGKKATAVSLIEKAGDKAEQYPSEDITFGSSLRDIADRLETLILVDDIPNAIYTAASLSETLSWTFLSTQTLASTSKSMAMLAEKIGDRPIRAAVSGTSDGKENIESLKSRITCDLDGTTGHWEVTNNSESTCYARLSVRKQSDPGTPVSESSNGIALSVRYYDEDGKAMSPEETRQGSTFNAEITVTNTNKGVSYNNLVLDYGIPSGWEIYNEALFAGTVSEEEAYDHKDIRDDCAIWYFGLRNGESKTFRVRIMASYEGKFILPATVCEAMYSPEIRANSGSGHAVVKGF